MKRVKKNIILILILLISIVSLIFIINSVKEGINKNDTSELENDIIVTTDENLTLDESLENENEPVYIGPDNNVDNENNVYERKNVFEELGIEVFQENLKFSLKTYYILVIILSIIFSISSVYLILSIFNKYSLKEIFASKTLLITLILGIVIITGVLIYYFDNSIIEKSDMKEYEKVVSSIKTNDINTLENYIIDDEGIKRNNSEKIKIEHSIPGIKINNLSIVSDSKDVNRVLFNYNIYNASSIDIEDLQIEIIFTDNSGNNFKILSFIQSLDAFEQKDVDGYSYQKIIDAKDYTFSIMKDEELESND